MYFEICLFFLHSDKFFVRSEHLYEELRKTMYGRDINAASGKASKDVLR